MLFLLCLLAPVSSAVMVEKSSLPWNLDSFPSSFEWGTATAAYQIEGAAFEGGRGPSIWDTFSHTKGKTHMGETGDIADDHYHRFREDVELMSDLGLRYYRLSVSWTRLLPNGRTDYVNAEGVAFYKTLFQLLKSKGITPLVTLFHWDLPQTFEDEYEGWLSRKSIEDFANFADFCFATFPEVSKWITFNEALTFIGEGYTDGIFAPGRCADRERCEKGDSVTEPFLAAHHVLLAHAAAVEKFKVRFPVKGDREIGMTNCGWMMWPLLKSDPKPAQDLMEGMWAWFADPVILGDYPESIKVRAGANLPVFTEEEKRSLKNSIDFLGVNYYSSRYVATPDEEHNATLSASGVPMIDENFALTIFNKHGVPLGPQAGSDWLFVVPEGLRALLNWLDERYDGIKMRITENGCSQPWWLDTTEALATNDTFRVDYFKGHIEAVGQALAVDDVNVVGYYAWSLLDNYEWADGYGRRFGIVYVDFPTQRRIPKLSAYWYAALVDASNQIDDVNNFIRQTPILQQGTTSFFAYLAPLVLVLGLAFGIVTKSQRSSSSSESISLNQSTRMKKMSVVLPPSTPRIPQRPRNSAAYQQIA